MVIIPRVYSDEKRAEIREQLMAAGIELIRKYGMKKMSIQEITSKVGIAQGTFYNFFKSREVFVWEIVREYQDKLKQRVEQIVQSTGGLTRDDVRSLYRATFVEDEASILRYLSRADIQTLVTRLPAGYVNDISHSREYMESVLQQVKDRNEACDLDLVFNWVQLLNLAVENKDLLSQVALEKTLDRIIDNLLDEIFA